MLPDYQSKQHFITPEVSPTDKSIISFRETSVKLNLKEFYYANRYYENNQQIQGSDECKVYNAYFGYVDDFKKCLTFVCRHDIIKMYPQEKRCVYLGIHKGTKLTDTPKDRTLKVRFDLETEKKLNVVCDKTNRTKSQVIRDGIEKQYNELKK